MVDRIPNAVLFCCSGFAGNGRTQKGVYRCKQGQGLFKRLFRWSTSDIEHLNWPLRSHLSCLNCWLYRLYTIDFNLKTLSSVIRSRFTISIEPLWTSFCLETVSQTVAQTVSQRQNAFWPKELTRRNSSDVIWVHRLRNSWWQLHGNSQTTMLSAFCLFISLLVSKTLTPLYGPFTMKINFEDKLWRYTLWKTRILMKIASDVRIIDVGQCCKNCFLVFQLRSSK